MKTNAAARPKKTPSKAGLDSTPVITGKIHPVVIYPFRPPKNYSDLEHLYELVARLDAARSRYARPITVMDRKTYYALEGNKQFRNFRANTVAKCSILQDAWCVDTCQMWYTGLAQAYESGHPGDVYWLIPGDFNYGTALGHDVLSRIHDLPEIIMELGQDICIGEIATDHNDSKQLIDTYGTFALLYNWFPLEAQEIRQFTERPRSEFFAISHNFLGHVLRQRWYAYEQTVVMLLQAVFGHRRISRFFVGELTDLPEGRDSLASALQQVERTERVIKSVWIEKHQHKTGWTQQYRRMEIQSEQIRRTALNILHNVLSEPSVRFNWLPPANVAK